MKYTFWGVLSLIFLMSDPAFATQANTTYRTVRANNTLQMKSFKPVTAVMIKKPAKLNARLRPIIVPKPVKPTGPDPQAAVDLSDMIDDTDLLEDLAITCGWDSHLIFQDKTAGNVFYYLPRVFLLVHDEATGYRLNVQYNHLKDADKPSVMLTAQLAAPHQTGDILLLKNILKQAFDLKPSDKLVLKSISGIGATVDVQAIAAGLSLPAERISVTMPSHLKQSFRLVLSLKQDEAEEVLAQMAREGLSGSLNVKVGETFVPIPMHLNYFDFSGSRVDGFVQWTDNQPIGVLRNITPFPVKIDSINCYKIKNGQLERISKKIKPSTIGPGKKKAFKLPPVNKVLGNNVTLAWLGTSLDTSCQKCIKSVDKEVRKGVATAPSKSVKFEAIPSVFSDFDIYKIIVQIQSPYFNADPGAVVTREVELTEEANIDSNTVIYQPEGKGSEPLLFKYRLKLITSDGNTTSENEWKDSRSASQFFGANHIEPVLGENAGDSGDDE